MNEDFAASIYQEERPMLMSTLKVHKLRWKNHMIFVMGNLANLYECNLFVDCTVHAEGQSLRAHKVILAAVSPYFDRMLKEEPHKNSFVLEDVQFQNLKSVFDFIYYGAVEVANDDLHSFMKVAELFQLQILCHPNHQLDTEELIVEKNSNHASCHENKNQSAIVHYGTEAVPNVSLKEASLLVGQASNSLAVPPTDLFSNVRIIESDDVVSANLGARINSASQIHEFPSQGISELHKIDNVEVSAAQKPLAVESGYFQPSEAPSSVKMGKYCIEFRDGNIDPFVTERAPNCWQQTRPDFRTTFENFKFHLENSFERELENGVLQNHTEVSRFVSSNDVNATVRRNLCRDSGILLGNGELGLSRKGFVCYECGENFSNSSGLRCHVYYVHKRSSAGVSGGFHLDQSISHRNLHAHMNSENPETQKIRCYPCPFCKKTCVSVKELKKHHKRHAQNHCCEVCKSNFLSKKQLNKHVLTHTRPFSCAKCGKEFENYTVLKGHMAIHTGSKPFPCAACGKSFGMLSSLTQHFLTHCSSSELQSAKGKNKVKCEKCKKKFKSHEAVQNHMYSVHPDRS